MLSNEEREGILSGFENNMKRARLVAGEFKYPSGGSHKHDEENPLGTHRHFDDEEIDGGHTHTPQNPGGEHAHGENKGRALIDGAHNHDGFFGDGYHYHDFHEENHGEIQVSEVPQIKPDQPSPE